MGCCQSAPRDEYQSSPYAPSNGPENASSHAIANNPSNFLTPSDSHTPSAQEPISSTHDRRRRHLAPGEHFNAPIRLHIWTSERQWSRAALDKERQDFFDTRVTGRPEIWATLKAVIDLLAQHDIATAQSILDAAAITVPTGDLKNGAYDEAGNLYQMPEHVISDPQNMKFDGSKGLDYDQGSLQAVAEDNEELEGRRDEKGKTVLKSGDIIRVKARLSDRGGPDSVTVLGKDQPVRTLIRRIQEEASISGKPKIRIAYMGKILKESESLLAQGWREGHVVNALVFP